VRFLYTEMALAKAQGLHVRNICEVGMYAGNSGNFWLLAFSTAHLYTFDKFKGSENEKLGLAAAAMLTRLGRTTFIRGQSGTTVPQFAREHPDVSCDIVFIDGSKAFEQRVADLTNFRALSHAKTLVLMDDIASEACLTGGACDKVQHTNYNTAQAAYRHKVDTGELVVHRCLQDTVIPDFPEDDIVCVGSFLY
jgi:predicted O-methyltransferase YrrM